MRFSIIFISLFFILTIRIQAQEITINTEYENEPLNEILEDLEGRLNVKFYYLPEWVNEIEISQEFQDTGLNEFLTKILEPLGITFQIYQSSYIVLIKDKGPSLEQREGDIASVAEQKIDPNAIIIGDPKGPAGNQNGTLSGYVREERTGEAIIGATLFVEELGIGTSSNQSGFYSITIPVGNYNIKVNYLVRARLNLRELKS